MAAACSLLAGCSKLAAISKIRPHEVSRYATCLALVLNTGTRVLESVPRHIAPATQKGYEKMAGFQAMALRSTLPLFTDAVPGATDSLMPPQRFLCWLATAAGALEAVERMPGSPGGWGPFASPFFPAWQVRCSCR